MSMEELKAEANQLYAAGEFMEALRKYTAAIKVRFQYRISFTTWRLDKPELP